MERLINRRQQGDLGEASAIEWLTRHGAVVFAPIGHRPDVDLIALVDGRALRIQVKTSVCAVKTQGGEHRWKVLVATRGGNQSWTGTVKLLDRESVDYVFVLSGGGRQWLLPAQELQGTTALTLGGPRYSEFEIEATTPIENLVRGARDEPLESDAARGSVGVWRAERDCKFRALALSEFESHLPHPAPRAPDGLTRVSRNHQVTIPVTQLSAADLRAGDRMRVRAEGPGAVSLRRIAAENDQGPPPATAPGRL